MSQHRFWTEGEIEILREMKMSGKRNKEIGKKLGRSATNIFAKSKSLGMKCIKSWTPEKEQEIKNLILEGYGVCDLAIRFGKSRKTIRLKLKNLGLYTEARKKDLEQEKFIKNGTRKCYLCYEVFPNTSDFFYNKRKCKKCIKRKSDATRLQLHSNNDLKKILKSRLYNCSSRSSRYQMELNISLAYLTELYSKQNGLCFYSKTMLSLSIGRNDSLSIDRIDSDKGYTIDNVVLCRKDVNMMKLQMATKDFIFLCKTIANCN